MVVYPNAPRHVEKSKRGLKGEILVVCGYKEGSGTFEGL
jgi:hypothetical protein